MKSHSVVVGRRERDSMKERQGGHISTELRAFGLQLVPRWPLRRHMEGGLPSTPPGKVNSFTPAGSEQQAPASSFHHCLQVGVSCRGQDRPGPHPPCCGLHLSIKVALFVWLPPLTVIRTLSSTNSSRHEYKWL